METIAEEGPVRSREISGVDPKKGQGDILDGETMGKPWETTIVTHLLIAVGVISRCITSPNF